MLQKASSRTFRRLLASSWLMLGMLFFSVLPALAGEFKIVPSIFERITWNDNIFLKGFEDIEARTEPKLDATYNTERSQLNLSGRLSDFRYAHKNRYDRTTYQANGGFSHTLSERLSAGLNGGWNKDFSLDTFWDDKDDERDMLGRDSYNAGGNISYNLTELDTIRLNFGWSTLDYAKRAANYSDYDMLNASLFWQHLIFDGTMALVGQLSWQDVRFDSPGRSGLTPDPNFSGIPIPVPYYNKQDITQNVYSGMAGLYWAPLEQLVMQIMAGASYTKSELDTKSIINSLFGQIDGSAVSHTYSTGFTASADMSWKEENWLLRLRFGQEHQPSAYGELNKVNSVSLSGYYNHTSQIFVYSSLRYYNSKSDNVTGNKISRDFFVGDISPRYNFTENFSTTLQYAYVYYKNKIENNTQSSNSIYLQFTYELPKSF